MWNSVSKLLNLTGRIQRRILSWKLHRKVSNWLNQYQRRIQKRLLLQYRLLTKPEIVEIEGIKIPVNKDLPLEPRSAIYMASYEKEELHIVKSQLDLNDIVMEMGTGLGFISTYCAKKIGSEGVFTYEANPALESEIRYTYTLNNVAPTLEMCLLGEQIGEQKFYVQRSFWTSSIVPQSPDDRIIEVIVKVFNQEVQRINPSFLIIDIEGGEYELMQYANFHNIQKILIELHESVIGQEKVEFVKAKLAESGFKINAKLSFRRELFLQRC